ncbi:Hypothetical predicted protein, partial [Podarcis lilfordi]
QDAFLPVGILAAVGRRRVVLVGSERRRQQAEELRRAPATLWGQRIQPEWGAPSGDLG